MVKIDMKKLMVLLSLLAFSTPLFAAQTRIVKMEKKWLNPVFTFKTDSDVQMRLTFYRPDVFRIEAAPNGAYADPLNDPKKAQIVIDNEIKKQEVKVTEDQSQIVFSTEFLTLILDRATSQFTLKRADGTLLWKETKPLEFAKDETLQYLSTDPKEQFFGGGQQNGYFTHKGRKIEIRADGNWNEGGHPNPAPFYMSNRGYAVLRNTFSVGAYDFTKNDQIVLAHREHRFDAYYFVGKTLNRMVDLYTQFTGRPNFIAIWALEMGDADCYMTRDKKTKQLVRNEKGEFVEITDHCVKRVAEQYRKHDMPGGWMLINDGYGCGYTNLVKVVKALSKLGFHTGLWTEKGLAKTKWEVGTAGIRVQKLDVAWTGPAYQFSLDANKQAWESLVTNSDSRGFVWTVQGWAGTQRYSVCWTGDQSGSWNLIRYHIPTLIGSGLSGQAYATTDVDGIFRGSPETYTRDLQWKCFTPVLYAMNGWSKMPKSPWKYEEPYRSINRKYLKLKMRLMPYMYHYVREANETGAPIVRGMVWEFPNDPKTWDTTTQHQYMLGESFLVAPVYTSMKLNKGWRKENIYFPKGRWIDYWDGRFIVGPYTLDAYPITLDKLPLFVRAGSIIPMYPEMLYNNQKPKDPLTLDIYPYGKSRFELYEDDGSTRKYQKGEFATQLFEMSAPKGVAGDLLFKIGPSVGMFDGKCKTRIYELNIHTPFKPKSVQMVGGDVLPELSSSTVCTNGIVGWFYDQKDRGGILKAWLPRVSTDKELTVKIAVDPNQPAPKFKPYPVPKVVPELDSSEFVVTASSAQRGSPISNAFDGTPETIWHSHFTKTPDQYPYTIDVDLGALRAINAFVYLPRQDGVNGRLAKYELYASRFKGKFDKPIASGTFEDSKKEQRVSFPTCWSRYLRIKLLSSANGKPYAAAAEFEFVQDLAAKAVPDEVKYLSDLKPASEKGKWNKDKSLGGKTITVNDQTYKKGLGVLSGSELVYKLDGTWDRLLGHVGMDDEVGSKGSVMFRVYGDGKLLFESPEMDGNNIKQLMDLDILGVKELKLKVLDLGDGSENDHADWVDVKLIRKGSE